MHFKKLQIDARLGSILTGFLSVLTLYLSWSGKLTLYIHPRYVLFTTVMAMLGTVLAVSALARPKTDGIKWPSRTAIASSILCLIVLVLALLLPPRPLTSTAATQRGINQSVTTATTIEQSTMDRFSGDLTNFTVKEWSGLLASTQDPGYYRGKHADITAFVAPTPENDNDTFYLSRFLITCCGVDAQPVGVPVSLKNWHQQFTAGEWLRIRGEFKPVKIGSKTMLALVPSDITKASQPETPYVY